MNRKLSLQPQPDVYLIHRLLFRLLPVQILLAAVSQINTIVSSLFASNYIGAQAMSAVGLYTPIGLLIGAVSVLFVSGSQIICGKFLGNNQVEQNSRLFSVSMLGTGIFSVITMRYACGVADGLRGQHRGGRPEDSGRCNAKRTVSLCSADGGNLGPADPLQG